MKAVLLYKDTINPLGLPDEYPAETRDIQQDETVAVPWVEMSESEIESRIAQYSHAVKQITSDAESIPQEIALWQFRAAVALAGLKDAVDAAIAALPEPSKTVATEKWEYGNTVRRNHAIITMLSAALGLTSTQVDNIFKTAASLQ